MVQNKLEIAEAMEKVSFSTVVKRKYLHDYDDVSAVVFVVVNDVYLE